MKRTQYFAVAGLRLVGGTWRIKDGEPVVYFSPTSSALRPEPSIFSAQALRTGHLGIRRITRDHARKICPKAFRKA